MKDTYGLIVVTWFASVTLALTYTLLIIWQIHTLREEIDYADIAGTPVPAVHCQEDEVISWTGPDALGCVHFEEVK